MNEPAIPASTPATLHGTYVRLVPLSQDHCAGLIDAASDGDLWRL